MALYTIKLIGKRDVAEGTAEFSFTKPEGFVFKAGQNCDWTLIEPPETDAEGNTRPFTLACAPYEDHLAIATRMRDTAFKRVLGSMPIGGELKIDGPMGSFMLQNDSSRPAVFLAGGIGITPFISMIREAAHDKLPHKLFLFYSNRRPQDAAFIRELTDLQNENPNYRLIATMTDPIISEESWEGELGYIDGAMLTRHLKDIHAPIYYLAGPPAMVVAMRKVLNDAGVNDDTIRTEEFSGY